MSRILRMVYSLALLTLLAACRQEQHEPVTTLKSSPEPSSITRIHDAPTVVPRATKILSARARKAFPVSTRDLFKETLKPSRQFTIPPSTDTVLTGSEGTRIAIAPGTFVTESGEPVQGPVQVELKECYAKSDMILSNLTTLSNGMMLESGGMIYLNATAGGAPVRIADGTSIRLEFPIREPKPDMQLFLGEKDDLGRITWRVAEEVAGPSMAVALPSYAIQLRVNPSPSSSGRDTTASNNREQIEQRQRTSAFNPNGCLTRIDKDQELVLREQSATTYILTTTRLGWINYDRFWNPSAPRMTVAIPAPKNETPMISMVFLSINAVIPGEPKGDSIVFENVPTGERATIVGLKYDGNRPHLAIRETIIGDSVPPLDYRRVTIEELRNQLATLR